MPVLQVPEEEEGRLGGNPNLLQEEEKVKGEEEKKEDYEEEEMEGKRRDGKDMQDSLVVDSSCLRALSAKKKLNNHIARRSNIMNYLVYPEAPDHLPLSTLLCLPKQCIHCSKLLKKVQPV